MIDGSRGGREGGGAAMGRLKMPYVVGYNWVKRKELPWNKEKLLKNVESVEGLRWRIVDAKGVVLGRLASHLSVLLQGKDKPTYNPSKDDGTSWWW